MVAATEELTQPMEPSQSGEREAEGLPPKSYADAADPASHVNGVEKSPVPDGSLKNGLEDSMHRPEQDMHAQTKKGSTQESKQESKLSQRKKQQKPKDKSDTNSDSSRRPSSSKSDGKANGIKADIANLYDDGVLEREYEVDGHSLVSSRAPKNYHSALAQSREEKRRSKTDIPQKSEEKKELVSGKQAGSRWSQSAIRWAPLNVPIQRRLQTLAVLVHTLSIAGLLTLFLFWCTIPLLWPILVPYLVYSLLSNAGTDGTLRYRSEWYRRLSWWSLFASYFPARLHRTQELQATRKYIFGYHPHGIISHGAFAAFATEALGFAQLFPGITNTLLTLDSNFRIPLYRDHALRLGLASVSKESCENLLNKGGINGEGMGRAITIVVGGARESLRAEPHYMRLILKCRKGFIKLAIRNGADLVPVLAFGENNLYEQVNSEEHPYIHKMQMLVKKIAGFTVPLFHARGVFNYDVGMLPYRRPIDIVFGRPIGVEQQQNPSDAYVNEIHERYTKELQQLWDTWKDTFAKERAAELDIVQ